MKNRTLVIVVVAALVVLAIGIVFRHRGGGGLGGIVSAVHGGHGR